MVPGQHAHADEERLLAADDAGAVQRLLERGGTADLGIDHGREHIGAGQAAEEARVEHGIEHAPAAAQDAGQARRRAHDVGDEAQQARVRAQQREELHAGRQLGQEAVEADEGEIGVGGLGQRVDQQRLHLGQQLAGARAAHGGIAAVMPAAHGGDDLGRIGKAHRRQRRRGDGIIGLAGEHHVGAAAGELGRVLEQGGVVALHARQLGRQRRGKCGRIIEAGEFRHTLQIIGACRQRLRLLVGDHLQAMLDRAQEAVGVRQARAPPRA